jgi:GTP-binding protein
MQSTLVIKSAEFVKSAVTAPHYPADGMPEVAFAGRSNVGKSSLINCLVQRKKLVRTSRTPGQTQTINFFLINNTFRFVDLPGYGFARVPQEVRAKWKPMVETYLTSRQSLRGVVHILDVRHPPTPDDLNLWNWLRERRIPAIPVLTKGDKIKRGNWATHIKESAARLGIAPDEAVLFSAETGLGRQSLMARIEAWVQPPLEPNDVELGITN